MIYFTYNKLMGWKNNPVNLTRKTGKKEKTMKYSKQCKVTTILDMMCVFLSFEEGENGFFGQNVQEYGIYVEYGDSLYAVNDLSTMADDGQAIVSCEDNRAAGKIMTTSEFEKLVIKFIRDSFSKETTQQISELPVILEHASNIDTDLDMQMEEDCEIGAIAVDNLSKMIIFIAA